MADDKHLEDQSDIPAIEMPKNGFGSRIPPYLLEGKTDAEQFMLNEVSKVSEYIQWSADALITLNAQLRHTNGKVSSLWALRNLFSGIRGTLIGICAAITGLAGLIAAIGIIKSLFTP